MDSLRLSRSWRALFLLGLVAICARASAGEFYEHDGLALRGYDPVAYFTEQRAVKGLPEFLLEHRGSTFRFASSANREAFRQDPARYAPQYGGYCAYGTARGYKAAIDPAAFRVVDGKLYLNYDASVQREWSKDVAGYIDTADRNWPAVSRQDKVHR
jgi:YHS domain-containing protein